MSASPLTGCVVTDSSGCHRYDYWNEQALFRPGLENGWCSPSRSAPATEFLAVDLGATCRVSGVRMLARAINKGAGFPRCITVETSQDGAEWARAAVRDDVSCPESTWYELTFPPVTARRLRLLLTDAAERADGKYFTQFMALQILGSPEPEPDQTARNRGSGLR